MKKIYYIACLIFASSTISFTQNFNNENILFPSLIQNGNRTITVDELDRISKITLNNPPVNKVNNSRNNKYLLNEWFTDDFNDGIIENSRWQISGDGISESGGMLNIFRNDADDFISTISRFNNDFEINVDINLLQIQWQDSFHGISLLDRLNFGISFGFSAYDNFFIVRHRGDEWTFSYYSS